MRLCWSFIDDDHEHERWMWMGMKAGVEQLNRGCWWWISRWWLLIWVKRSLGEPWSELKKTSELAQKPFKPTKIQNQKNQKKNEFKWIKSHTFLFLFSPPFNSFFFFILTFFKSNYLTQSIFQNGFPSFRRRCKHHIAVIHFRLLTPPH